MTLLVVTVGCGVLAFAAPSLALLRAAQALVPPSPAELEGLVPVLAACLQRPDLAALVAELAPALAHCPGPHAEVMHAVVGAAPPPLQHLGLEAFYRYAKACPPANIMAALPPAMRHPGARACLCVA